MKSMWSTIKRWLGIDKNPKPTIPAESLLKAMRAINETDATLLASILALQQLMLDKGVFTGDEWRQVHMKETSLIEQKLAKLRDNPQEHE